MQALWSRAGQCRRRGCRPCAGALAARRRAATAGRRRKPTFTEVFTACYSSIFATAAVVNAVRKEERRRSLEFQLEEARRELQALQSRDSAAAPETGPGSTDLSMLQMEALWRSLKMIHETRPYMKEIHKPATVVAPDLFANMRSDRYGCPSEAALRVARQIDYDALERAILAEEVDDVNKDRCPLNPEQLLQDSASVKLLVEKLLIRALQSAQGLRDSNPLDQEPDLSPSYYEACDLAIKDRLQWTFRGIDEAGAMANTTLLNGHLRAILQKPLLSVKEKIGRICYNLLVSAHAPNIHTYNTLIVAFDKAGMHRFSDALIHSFYYKRLLKPTPSTFWAILNHFKVAANHGRFLDAIARLTGVEGGTGGKIRRRHLFDIANDPWLVDWALDVRFRTLKNRMVYEHVPLDQLVAEEAIYGLLQFRLYHQAASLFFTCVLWGIHLSTQVVKQLLDECIVALDWRGSLEMIRGFIRCKRQWRAMLLTGDGVNDWYLVSRIYALLDLTGLRGAQGRASEACLDNLDIPTPELDGLMEALGEQTARLDGMGFLAADAPATSCGEGGLQEAWSKMRLMQIESVWKEYIEVRNRTRSIESKMLKRGLTNDVRAVNAQFVCDAAVQVAKELWQEAEQLVGRVPRPVLVEWSEEAPPRRWKRPAGALYPAPWEEDEEDSMVTDDLCQMMKQLRVNRY